MSLVGLFTTTSAPWLRAFVVKKLRRNFNAKALKKLVKRIANYPGKSGSKRNPKTAKPWVEMPS